MNIDRLVKKLDKLNKDEKLDIDKPSLELAEMINDRVHLALSKVNPEWQEQVLLNESDEEIPELNILLRKFFEKVIKANGIVLTPQYLRELTKYLYQIKSDYLARYCSAKADYLFNKIRLAIKEGNSND